MHNGIQFNYLLNPTVPRYASEVGEGKGALFCVTLGTGDTSFDMKQRQGWMSCVLLGLGR